MKVLVSLVGLIFIFANAQTMYVKSLKAKIYEKPHLGSKVVATIKKGEKVKVLDKKGNWHFVKYDGVKGWVYSLLIGPDKPPQEVPILGGEKESDIIKGRKRSSTNITAAASRGLTEDFRKRKKEKYVSNYRSLERMESIRISQEEIEEFGEKLK